MEEYDVKLRYLEGENSVLADCFSQMPRMEKPGVSKKELESIQKKKGKLINWRSIQIPKLIVDNIYL